MSAPVSLAEARKNKRQQGNAGGNGADDAPPGEEENDEYSCPVTALGHTDGKFWFLNIIGERRGLSARQLGSRSDMTGLFLGNVEWLSRRFKAVDQDGMPKGWSVAKAMEYLMDACSRAGIYGEHIVIRRPGVWAGDGGVPIAHCGDAMFFDGEKMPTGQKMAGQIFAAAARQPYPADVPAQALVAQEFAQDIRTLWNLQCEGGEVIALGLVGQGFYAAALNWRSNGFICGGSNAGKSMLLELLMAMTPLNHYSNNTSVAGVVGAIDGRALPIFLDETTEQNSGEGARALLDMVLTSSSGSGMKGHRGTADGGMRAIEMVGSVIMASINTPEMQPQHRSRFSVIEVVRPESGADHKAQMLAAIARAKVAGPGLFARALMGFDRYTAALKVLRKALGAAGCVAREMDHLGSILAGYWVLAEDGVPDEDTAAEIVKMVSGFVIGAEEMMQDSTPQKVLAMLMSQSIILDRSTDRESLVIMLETIFGKEESVQAEHFIKVLKRWGIRPVRESDVFDPRQPNRLIPRMANGNGIWIDERWDDLINVFANTDYGGGRWYKEMTRLPSARKATTTVRVTSLGPWKPLWISWCDIVGGDDG